MYTTSNAGGARQFASKRSETRRLWRSRRRANSRNSEQCDANARDADYKTQGAAELGLRPDLF